MMEPIAMDRKDSSGSAPTARDRREVIHWTLQSTELGPLLIAATGAGLCLLSFDTSRDALAARFARARLVEGGGMLDRLAEPILAAMTFAGRTTPAPDNETGHGERKTAVHHLPFDLRGTAFQQSVWAQLRLIPRGQTRSYQQIATAIGRPGATRAVGSANGANPIAVLIPCHRVIRADGTIGGYAHGAALKHELLRREGVVLG
ncbi:methylated-DNA--[protein]-cysteine S-methyltransferase [Croceicoccus sp. F390]|uniref:Methylated-DNA--[protein]-cysteine S-methyltransferase n=1 Tax=Croceicoccus esteveae TaxID=3075597 RepID=A0ABU2ZEL0_9SPHN|nr:methylated-DNA--[protein]-cysteine S-methyltransferase [Croceicoccus sp. F390]MDT0575035.1 methylated-DNA--[protein]-cysteine S-methyltransferase [Croceicoccus sp. F390]